MQADIAHGSLDAGRVGSGRFYLYAGDVSRCDQTCQVVSSNLVADGIGFAGRATFASALFLLTEGFADSR